VNANLRWMSVFAFVVTYLFPSTDTLRAQVLIDPRGEDGVVQSSAESPTAESTPSESTASESVVSEDARRESPLTERRTLPPPQEPGGQVPATRTPPPRPSAALPAASESEPALEPQRRTGRPYLGITFDPTVRDAAVVGATVPDSPAEQAGLQPGDEIVAINDQPVGTIEETFAAVGRLRPGEIVNIEFSRRITARTQALLEDAPDDAVADAALDTLPERRSTSYREPPRTDYEERLPSQRDNQQDRIRILRRYGEDEVRTNPDNDERRELDRRELEERLRDRQRPPERPLRRPLLRWRRG
jgi:membrane-associated protease RseP (regulator of RpoE activity)